MSTTLVRWDFCICERNDLGFLQREWTYLLIQLELFENYFLEDSGPRALSLLEVDG